jgi:hypothetical protein
MIKIRSMNTDTINLMVESKCGRVDVLIVDSRIRQDLVISIDPESALHLADQIIAKFRDKCGQKPVNYSGTL